MSFGGGTPSLPAETPLPTMNDPAIAEARARERRMALLRKGRASTILTDQANMEQPTLARKSLLGQ